MTTAHSTATPPVLVAIDVAKARHDILVELPDGRRGVFYFLGSSHRPPSGCD